MKRTSSTRPVPQRTCVACRQTRAKRELVRLVRTHGGDIEIDTSGKKEGRGAYLCPDRGCWEKALRGRQLEHTLRGSLTAADRERIARQGQELLKGAE
ncbi:MAG: YlxR family protein [Chloroflexota bacterium]